VACERRAQAGTALVSRGIVLNVLLAVLKITGGIWGNAYALVADGIESLLDIISSALVWTGLRVASRPPDTNHPYGHGKAEPLAGIIVALLTFAASGWIAWRSINQITAPSHSPHWGTLPLLACVVSLKLFYSRRLRAAEGTTGSTALGIEAWHHYADALTSAAAFVGISIAVIGGAGYESADGWAALAACLIITWNGVGLFRKALNDVMDMAVPGAFEGQVRATAAEVADVRGIDKCRIRKSGLSYLVDIHVEVDPALSVRQGHDIAGAVKHALLRSPLRISDVLVHIEPAAR
jgi:cation diffusion facilitator family transporter